MREWHAEEIDVSAIPSDETGELPDRTTKLKIHVVKSGYSVNDATAEHFQSLIKDNANNIGSLFSRSDNSTGCERHPADWKWELDGEIAKQFHELELEIGEWGSCSQQSDGSCAAKREVTCKNSE